MRKATLRLTSDRLSNSLMFFSVVAILSAMWSSAIHYSKPNFEIQEVVDIEYETKEVHCYTDDELSLLYSCKDEPICDTCLLINQTDAEMLMKIAASEAGDMGEDAQLLVMEVIINRLNDDRFPDTISEIINAPKQFAVMTNGVYKKTEPNVDSHMALARLESGERISEGALYFESSSNSKDSWHSKNRTFLFEKYGQRFYK